MITFHEPSPYRYNFQTIFSALISNVTNSYLWHDNECRKTHPININITTTGGFQLIIPCLCSLQTIQYELLTSVLTRYKTGDSVQTIFRVVKLSPQKNVIVPTVLHEYEVQWIWPTYVSTTITVNSAYYVPGDIITVQNSHKEYTDFTVRVTLSFQYPRPIQDSIRVIQ